MEEFHIHEVSLEDENEVERVKTFLESINLNYEEDISLTITVEDQQGNLIGTGSLGDKVIKCVGVKREYEEYGIGTKIVSYLLKKAYEMGKQTVFIFTKPQQAEKFQELGFKEVARSGPIVLLETGIKTIKDYQTYLKSMKNNEVESAGAVVVNCNPFTNGHKYLIEYASSHSKWLYIIVVEEERSSFPFAVRYRLIKEGTSHLKNVTLIKGGNYNVSSATFPSYFLRDEKAEDIAYYQAKLDVTIFATYTAPILNIKRRFVGEEPYSPTTAQFNRAMKEVLPANGIELIEIKRVSVKNTGIVSASKVRQFIREDNWEAIKEQVPETTYRFLISEEAKPIIEKIKRQHTRH